MKIMQKNKDRSKYSKHEQAKITIRTTLCKTGAKTNATIASKPNCKLQT